MKDKQKYLRLDCLQFPLYISHLSNTLCVNQIFTYIDEILKMRSDILITFKSQPERGHVLVNVDMKFEFNMRKDAIDWKHTNTSKLLKVEHIIINLQKIVN